MRKILAISICLVSLTAVGEPVNPGLYDTWQFSFGVLDQRADMKIRSTRAGDPPIDIDLDNLGLSDSEVVPQIGARWRMNDRWAMNFVYSGFNIKSNKTVDRTFNFDGVEYPINATLKSKIDIDLYVFAIDYSFGRSDTTEWGLGLGIHAIGFSTDISGNFNNVPLAASSEDFLAPLPNARIFVRHAFTPKLLGSVSGGWLGIKVGKYDGALIVASATLDYRFTDRWSLGLNYQLTDIDLDIDRQTKDSNYDIRLDGFSLVAKYTIP